MDFSKNISYLQVFPYKVFKIENFFEKNYYNNLRDNFPEISRFSNEELTAFDNNKFGLTSESIAYKNFISSNGTYAILDNIIRGKQFFNFFIKKFYFNFIFSRINSLKHIVKIFKIPKLSHNSDKTKFYSLYNKINVQVQFSYIENNGMIVPHTDAGNKLFTLMLYFPDKDLTEEDKSKEKKYGTTFYNIKKKSDQNRHLSLIERQEFLITNKEKSFRSNFSENTLVGFVKNDVSWHSVEPIDIKKDYIRRSININFFY